MGPYYNIPGIIDYFVKRPIQTPVRVMCLGAGYGDGPKHETSETSETKSETILSVRNQQARFQSKLPAGPLSNLLPLAL